MKIILRTRCGCTRVISEGVILNPPPPRIYVPLPAESITSEDGLTSGIVASSSRKFIYWSHAMDDTVEYREAI